MKKSDPFSAGKVAIEKGKVATKEDSFLTNFTPRERVLAAALKLFVEQGYFNTNIPDLSRESRCSVGSIYHNFKNKEQVAIALYDEGIRAFRQALSQSLLRVKGGEPEIIVRALVKSLLEFAEVNHHLSKYMWLCRHNEFMTESVRQPTNVGFDLLGRELSRAIKTGIRRGTIRPLPAQVIWAILFGVPLSYIRDWLDGTNSLSPSQVVEDLSESCWRALVVSC